MHRQPSPRHTPGWQNLHQAGAAAAFVIAALLLGEIGVFAAYPRPATALDHFALFQTDPLAGLLTLDLLGLVAYLLFVPVAVGLYVALRRSGEATMAVASVLFLLGVADFLATNTLFPVLELSQRYAAATTTAEQAAILAAGEAMFVLFNENAFLVSYIIVSFAWALTGTVMLRTPEFGRLTGSFGLLAGAAGIVAVVLEHTSGDLVPVAIPVYFAAIAFLIGWMLLVGRRLAALSRPPDRAVARLDVDRPVVAVAP